jgi:predicted RNase H-like HicB family nuclease
MKKELSTKLHQKMVPSVKKAPKDYLKEPYARILIPEEDGGFSAEVLEFPGCYAQGETAGEAFTNLEKAAIAWIEVCLDQGQEIPPPSSNQGYSGRLALRMPRALHRAATHKAHRDGVSLNQCLVTAVAAWVGADNLVERMAHKIEMNFVQANFIQIIPFSGAATWAPLNLPSNAAVTVIPTPPKFERLELTP